MKCQNRIITLQEEPDRFDELAKGAFHQKTTLNDAQKVIVAKTILSLREDGITQDYIKEGGDERRIVIDEILMLSVQKILDL